MKNGKLLLAMAILLCGWIAVPFPSARAAVVWEVDGAGRLVGARNLEFQVGGVLGTYDVAFTEGTCAGLFGGCDENSDFFFQNATDAANASYALRDQVFLDGVVVNSVTYDFDNLPELTIGCGPYQPGTSKGCIIENPYEISSPGYVRNRGFGNAVFPNADTLNFDVISNTLNTADDIYRVFGLFTPSGTGTGSVPEPGTMLLLGAGLVGLAARRRRTR